MSMPTLMFTPGRLHKPTSQAQLMHRAPLLAWLAGNDLLAGNDRAGRIREARLRPAPTAHPLTFQNQSVAPSFFLASVVLPSCHLPSPMVSFAGPTPASHRKWVLTGALCGRGLDIAPSAAASEVGFFLCFFGFWREAALQPLKMRRATFLSCTRQTWRTGVERLGRGEDEDEAGASRGRFKPNRGSILVYEASFFLSPLSCSLHISNREYLMPRSLFFQLWGVTKVGYYDLLDPSCCLNSD